MLVMRFVVAHSFPHQTHNGMMHNQARKPTTAKLRTKHLPACSSRHEPRAPSLNPNYEFAWIRVFRKDLVGQDDGLQSFRADSGCCFGEKAKSQKPKATNSKKDWAAEAGERGENATENDFEARLTAASPMSRIPVTSLRLT